MLLGARPVLTDPGDSWPPVAGQLLGAPVMLVSRGPAVAESDSSRRRSCEAGQIRVHPAGIMRPLS